MVNDQWVEANSRLSLFGMEIVKKKEPSWMAGGGERDWK